MRISFLLTQSLESPSGLGRFGPLARHLAQRGHSVSVFALHPDFSSLPETHFVQNGVQVHYVAPMHVHKRGNLKSYYSSGRLIQVAGWATWKLCQAALREPADAVFVAKPHPMNSIAGLASRFLQGKTLFLDCDDYEAAVGRFGRDWQRLGVGWFENMVPHHARLVTTNTNFTRQRLINIGLPPERVIYLPNGVESQRFASPDPIRLQELRQSLGLQDKKVVLFIGTLSLPSHPIDLLLEAFTSVHAAHPDVVLLLVGGGEDYNGLQEQAFHLGLGDSVCFTGRVNPDQAVYYYHLADISVDPVLDNDVARGRSPLKLFESWICGVPFVSGDVGDRALLLGDPPAGRLCKPGDPKELALALNELLENPSIAQKCSLGGLERVRAYDWARLAEQLEGIYLPLLRAAGRKKNPIRTMEASGKSKGDL